MRLPLLLFALSATKVARVTAEYENDGGGPPPNTRLLSACLQRQEDSVSEIAAALEAGADIDVRDEGRGRSGQTCLMGATLRDKQNTVRFVLEKGADPNIAEKDGYTPPHGAGFQGRAEVMKILKEEGNIDVINSKHPDGYSPLHRACWGRESRHAETVEYLLSIGDDVNRRGTGEKKLTCMEMTQNPATIEVLKKYGAVMPGEAKGGDEL